MAVFTDLLNDVMPEIPGSPPISLVTDQIRRTVIRFLDRTKVIRRTTPALGTQDFAGPWPLDSATFGTGLVSGSERVIEVRSAAFQGRELIPTNEAGLVNEFGPAWANEAGTPRFYTESGGLFLVPRPAATPTSLILAVSVSLLPTATTFPDSILNNYRETLAFGAKAAMFYMMNVPWSNQVAADINFRQFENRMDAIAVRVARQNSANRLLTRPYSF